MLFKIHNFIDNWNFDELFNALYNTEEDVTIDIDSCGGNLREAWKMYDAIRTHKGNVIVNVSGDCMSAAILILLAAKPENRFANINAEFMIHKPLLEWWDWTLKDEDCVQIHDEITKETAKLKACYMERTNASETEIDTLINSEQIFGVELAISLGFINKKNEYVNKKSKAMNKKSNKIETLLRNLFVKAGLLNQKEYTTADDETLIVETDEDPKVGDETPNADGIYLMPDGKKFVVSEGKIESIEEPAPTTTEEPDTTNEGDTNKPTDDEDDEKEKELENLRKQVATLQDKADQFDSISALVNKCGGEKALNALLNSRSQEPNKKTTSTETEDGDDNYNHFKNL